MQRFSELLDRLSYEPRRNAKLALLTQYFGTTPDPERGLALAALTDGLDFRHAKPAMLRGLIAERTDPELFALSYDFVGDLSETIALMWPANRGVNAPPPLLSDVVVGLRSAGKSEVPGLIAGWLDTLDETGRWALLKLVTGGMRVGVSARLAKTAVAGLGPLDTDRIEEAWHGLDPPYEALFAWAEGRAPAPLSSDPAPFRPPMLARPIEPETFAELDPAHFAAEWKWDGIRVQAVAGRDESGTFRRRLFSRSGEDISEAFPDLVEQIDFEGSIDGELLVVRAGRVQSFNELQQRLNRKSVTKALLKSHPVAIRAYDLLSSDGRDLRELAFEARRGELESFVERLSLPAIGLSPLIGFRDWDELAAARANPAGHIEAGDAEAVEGVMVKRRDAPYVPGRPKGLWFKWKRDPYLVDAVLLYAQRGHGKRSSFYSDYTFGVWRDEELVPVGKAYFGFTDEELFEIDRFVRNNTTNRFGPVREVAHTKVTGLVLEVAFEGIARSTRHKSGLAMRFPRVHRLRWDKKPEDADRIELLEALVPGNVKA
ncbi:cisplatin damage response ATP-dependent DNA ligase [Stappia sp. F7233]|uniref:DNA ligase (ATP) n=1 Tax=Stappia albiluteola TaxID=2758565 RepID=A0A839AK40_9HYPH|nr:cisplatin damage response ATP-dependent DNA ligase [Stappia albiluteola]MBA5779147.1 cisplatin damage response ATP-dependent DNA ligase [Stappia albiluteola]